MGLETNPFLSCFGARNQPFWARNQPPGSPANIPPARPFYGSEALLRRGPPGRRRPPPVLIKPGGITCDSTAQGCAPCGLS